MMTMSCAHVASVSSWANSTLSSDPGLVVCTIHLQLGLSHCALPPLAAMFGSGGCSSGSRSCGHSGSSCSCMVPAAMAVLHRVGVGVRQALLRQCSVPQPPPRSRARVGEDSAAGLAPCSIPSVIVALQFLPFLSAPPLCPLHCHCHGGVPLPPIQNALGAL